MPTLGSNQTLSNPKSPDIMNSRISPQHSCSRRVVYGILLSLLAVIVMDVSFARMRYHYRLASDLTPMKSEIEISKYEYHGSVAPELQDCHAYDRESDKFVRNCTLAACEQNALLLSERRQVILQDVRSIHPVADWVSELFDGARGVNQTTKIRNLFSRKSCERIIGSSDKTNRTIDFLSLLSFFAAVVLLWISIRLLLYR
jgi:hypothetical protein